MRIQAAILLTTSFLAIGCINWEEKYNDTSAELKKTKAEWEADKKSCADAETALKKKNAGLADENQVMKTRLVSLGEDLTKMKTQAGHMVADLSQKEKQITELEKAQAAAKKRAQVFKDLFARLKNMIDSGKLKVSVRKGRMIVQMNDKILFAPGKAKLKDEGQAALSEVTQVLVGIKGRSFQVAGHTDNVPIRRRGKIGSNWELSAARAVNVVKFMVEKGMDPSRISAAGYGPNDPTGDNSTEDGRRENRRIEITLMPSLSDLPKIDV